MVTRQILEHKYIVAAHVFMKSKPGVSTIVTFALWMAAQRFWSLLNLNFLFAHDKVCGHELQHTRCVACAQFTPMGFAFQKGKLFVHCLHECIYHAELINPFRVSHCELAAHVASVCCLQAWQKNEIAVFRDPVSKCMHMRVLTDELMHKKLFNYDR